MPRSPYQARSRTLLADAAWHGTAVTDRWGRIAAKALAGKFALPVIDGLLAATAMQHNLTLVSRNTKDVAATDVALFNPWAS
jgi:toxin FitB